MFKHTLGLPGVNSSISRRLSLQPFLLFCCLVGYGANSPARLDTQRQNPPSIISLEPDKPIESEIAGGQVQSYRITLSAAGQFVSVVVRQRGIDVLERLFAPDGKLVAQFDSEFRIQEAESVDFVAATPGAYRLEIKAKIKNAVGRYEIRIAEVRTASEQDRSLHEAHKLSTESANLGRAGKYEEALSCATRAVDAGEKALGMDHAYVAYLLGELANRQRLNGELVKAEASLQRALAISEKALGPEHPQTVETLHVLALVYERKGDNAKALQILEQALEITGRTLGTEHPNFAAQLISMGGLRSDLADLVQAERDWQRALTIAEKTLELNDSTIREALNNLGMLYLLKKDYERSEPLLLRALASDEETRGPEHPLLIAPLLNLGRLARERKNYARALELYQRALAIAEKTYGADSPEVGALLNNIANVHKSQGDYETPLPLYQRVLRISERSLGPYDGLAILALGNIANLYAARGDIANAIAFQARVDERIEGALTLNLAIGSERQKLAYFGSLAERTDRTVSLHVRLAAGDGNAGALAALVLLQRKGRILDAMSDNLTALRNRFDAGDQKLLDQLNATTAQLARLALNGPQKMTPDEYRKQLSNLEEQKEKLEADVSRRSAEFRAQTQPVTLAAVQAAIPPDAALVEFATFRPFNPRAENNSEAYGQIHYVAYVLRSQGAVQWKELGEAQAIEGAIDELRQALRDPINKDVRQLARAVDQRVMQPVRALTGDATQMLISPDGALNLIPFAALVDEDGRYLIQRYSFAYLTSGRDLLRMRVARESKGKPLVLANPSFGEPAGELVAVNKPATATSKRQSVTTAANLSEVYFAPLGGTAQEAHSIQTLFPDANILTAAQATESAVKQTNAPRVLHLATHGFFLSEPESYRGVQAGSPAVVAGATASSAQTRTRGINTNARIANPLLRSGLAFAGANLHNNSNDDGILTALEASGLNLWGTKLVVLSACDTGLGEVRNGEGVYGLRRAFVLAGAESLVMSLWPISDYSTRTLMTNYYKNLRQGLGRGESLRQVQLDLLKRDPKLHPFYWANFIQSGEWANLDGRR